MTLKPPGQPSHFMNIVDRRLNPGGKSLGNVNRMTRKLSEGAKEQLVKTGIQNASIVGGDEDTVVVEVPRDVLAEPTIRKDLGTGQRDHVLPGNKVYEEGDKIKRPQGNGQGKGQGQGNGQQAGEGGGGNDAFRFRMDRKKFMEMLFEGMRLPYLEHVAGLTSETKLQRAGHTTTGPSERLDLARSARNALARRIALKRPRPGDVEAEEEKLKALKEEGDSAAIILLEDKIATLKRKSKTPWMDTTDLHYRRYEQVKKPNTAAVMGFMMDTSASMGEQEKLAAKAFALATLAFLEKEYGKGNVSVFFIRHTDTARRVDQKEFIEGTDTGGTKSSTAFEMAEQIMDKEFPAGSFNRYFAYIGDGDNTEAPKVAARALKKLSDKCRFGVYLETKPTASGATSLMAEFGTVLNSNPDKLSLQRALAIHEIHPALRRMFTFQNPKMTLKAALAGGVAALEQPMP